VKAGRPSFTAAWVAGARGLGALLPPEARLAEDPFGARFGGRSATALARVGRSVPRVAGAALALLGPLAKSILYMQVRTRLLDDVLLEFARAGGRQVVLLGAGFDCRAARFREALDGAVVYEVDHPATQARKRAVLGAAASARVEYLAWDFEQPTALLPSALAALGHDPRRPTLTIWEGVTMYLTDEAIEQTVAAVAAWTAPGSLLAFTYFERGAVERPSWRGRLLGRLVARVGEPFRYGWDPAALGAWLERRGFQLAFDRSADEAGRALLPARWARAVDDSTRHIALARRA
jgi:methyltransferase (TIGR00027 family)